MTDYEEYWIETFKEVLELCPPTHQGRGLVTIEFQELGEKAGLVGIHCKTCEAIYWYEEIRGYPITRRRKKNAKRNSD